ncbi:hypothetical protein TBR22_A12770 [Luteitalea sp. TBR-22]|uniref:hypothetical protein n=1 Tax=Luteitalea sp. TBR-22 TaxID=2802971 RepID=UPI001AF5E15D|nr:hypothetical protein [Luteitalea sp. TBR-22]BCS32072.1 hypothetical protein TBR22_A12770 [Luteitalea sp. TBR-22]
MTTDDRDVLSALLDNEPVDADLLARLLEVPGNRALLVDFVRLRAALRDADPPGPTPVPQHVPRPPMTRVFLRSAAGLALVGLGLAGGAWYARHAADASAAPTPSRIVQLAPLDASR